MKNRKHFDGFQTQHTELTHNDLTIKGDVPKWLSGSFISNGPAQFEVGDTHFNHWFDGFAMLKKFTFNSGKVSFSNRFIHSQQFVKSNTKKKLHENEFATYADKSLLGRTRLALKDFFAGNSYDNCNINTISINQQLIAMTESSHAIEINLDDLSTKHVFRFCDTIKNYITTAHPQIDINSGEIINICIEIGINNTYHVLNISPETGKKEITKSYTSDTLFYMHSFSITKNYVILFKSPITLNKWKLILGLPFNDAVSWQKNIDSSFFIIIDRRTGIVKEIETDAFVCLHSANAYECGNEIILDLICHPDNPYSYFYFSNLRTIKPNLPRGVLRRYSIDLNSNKCRYTALSNEIQEFPRINYHHFNGTKYTFLYTNVITKTGVPFLNALQKTNIETGQILRWERDDAYPGEAVFIPRNEHATESDGVLLSIVNDAQTLCSSLIILDANNMQLLCDISLPILLPFGLHGNFYTGFM